MDREELEELQYIAPVSNVLSMAGYGILSHRRAKRLDHESVAAEEIQNRRVNVRVPGGRRLHEYANLYICARNPMLYRCLHEGADVCVLRVSTDVLDLPGVVVTDGNASSDYVRFASAPQGLRIVDKELTFARSWWDSDQIVYWRRKFHKNAEVLVPDVVEPRFIMGAWVASKEALERFDELDLGVEAREDGYLFFYRG